MPIFTQMLQKTIIVFCTVIFSLTFTLSTVIADESYHIKAKKMAKKYLIVDTHI